MDPRSLGNLETLHPKFRQSAIDAWTEAQAAMPENVKVIVICGGRTFAESDALYAIGRTVMGEDPTPEKPMGEVVTDAKAGESFHDYDLAFDFAMVTNGKDDYVVGPHWMKVVEICKTYGMEWGGDWEKIKDNPHFENRYGYTWEQLLAKYEAKDFLPGTTYVNI